MSVIIGSTALRHWFPDFKREPKDIDLAVENITKVISVPPTIGSKRIENLPNNIIANHCKGQLYASPEILLTLKMSHVIGFDIFWQKHIGDILFLQDKGVKYNRELMWELYEYWNTVHGKNKRSDLSMSAEDFFTNALDTNFDHDLAHTLLIKHPFFEEQVNPTYQLVLKDGAEVDIDEGKFNKLTEKGKYNLVIEEVCLMALERWPKEKFWNSYSKMLKKFLINHAPLFEAEWMINNWKWLCRPPFDFKTHLNEELYEQEMIRNR